MPIWTIVAEGMSKHHLRMTSEAATTATEGVPPLQNSSKRCGRCHLKLPLDSPTITMEDLATKSWQSVPLCQENNGLDTPASVVCICYLPSVLQSGSVRRELLRKLVFKTAAPVGICSGSWLLVAHHRHKFVKVDLAVSISVELLHQLGQVPVRQRLYVVISKDVRNLVLANRTVAIAVKHAEGSPADIFGHVQPLVQSSRQEFGVVDGAVPINVHFLHDLVKIWRYVLKPRLAHPNFQLIGCQLTVAIGVKGLERFFQSLDLTVGKLLRDDVQRRLLQLVR